MAPAYSTWIISDAAPTPPVKKSNTNNYSPLRGFRSEQTMATLQKAEGHSL